jgi:hypothetical protein
MDIPEIELVLSRNMAKIVESYLGITRQYVKKFEKRLLKQYNSQYTLLFQISITDRLIGLFTTKEKAIKYMIRDGLNNWLSCIQEGCEVPKDKKIFDINIKEWIDENYELITLTENIDINNKIYVDQTFNLCATEKKKCLTNSLEEWKKINIKYKKCVELSQRSNGSEKNKNDWIEKCIIKVDPNIDELEVDCLNIED